MKKNESLTHLEQLVLTALLSLRDDVILLAVYVKVEVLSDRRFQVPSVYITLDRLVEKGYAQDRLADEVPERGNKRSRYFRLLPAGDEALDRSQATSQRLLDSWRTAKCPQIPETQE